MLALATLATSAVEPNSTEILWYNNTTTNINTTVLLSINSSSDLGWCTFSCEYKKRYRNNKLSTMEIETIKEYADIFFRVTLATSPILIIAYVLITAREDEEEEKAKLEEAKKSGSCKT